MSELKKFVSAAYAESKSIIGTSTFEIGSGNSVQVIEAEDLQDRDSEMNGFRQTASLRLVCSLSDFVAEYPSETKSYIGKLCTHDGDNWRIASIESGFSFVMINLSSINEVE